MKNTRRGFLSFLAAIPAAFGVKAVAAREVDKPKSIDALTSWPSSEDISSRLGKNAWRFPRHSFICDCQGYDHTHRRIGDYCQSCGKLIG